MVVAEWAVESLPEVVGATTTTDAVEAAIEKATTEDAAVGLAVVAVATAAALAEGLAAAEEVAEAEVADASARLRRTSGFRNHRLRTAAASLATDRVDQRAEREGAQRLRVTQAAVQEDPGPFAIGPTTRAMRREALASARTLSVEVTPPPHTRMSLERAADRASLAIGRRLSAIVTVKRRRQPSEVEKRLVVVPTREATSTRKQSAIGC